MGRLWTLGLTWGLVAWIPFFLNLPMIFSLTLGLPVIVAGYLLVGIEMLIGAIPDVVGFCFSLPTGVALTWLLYTILLVFTGQRSKKVERGVE